MPDPRPYSGPRPSPARPWTPWVIGGAVISASSYAAQAGLHLLERHYVQERFWTYPPGADRMRLVVDTVHALSALTAVVVFAWCVLTIVWVNQRRPRLRLRAYGEASVEAALRRVSPAAWTVAWTALAVGIGSALVARGVTLSLMRADDFARYRGYLAVSCLGRAVAFAAWAILAARANVRQAEREATPAAQLAARAITREIRSGEQPRLSIVDAV